MPRGGPRRNAGRPKGRRDSKPRRWHRPNINEGDPETRKAFIEYCHSVTSSGRASQIIDAALDSDDPGERRWAVTLAVSYSLGMPTNRVVMKEEKGLDEKLAEWQREVDAAEAAKQPLPLDSVTVEKPS